MKYQDRLVVFLTAALIAGAAVWFQNRKAEAQTQTIQTVQSSTLKTVNFQDADPNCPLWPVYGAPYNLSNVPNPPQSLLVILNSNVQDPSDYTLNGTTFTFNSGYQFQSIDEVRCVYRY